MNVPVGLNILFSQVLCSFTINTTVLPLSFTVGGCILLTWAGGGGGGGGVQAPAAPVPAPVPVVPGQPAPTSYGTHVQASMHDPPPYTVSVFACVTL